MVVPLHTRLRRLPLSATPGDVGWSTLEQLRPAHLATDELRVKGKVGEVKMRPIGKAAMQSARWISFTHVSVHHPPMGLVTQ